MKILCKAIFLAVAVCAALCEGRASRPLWDDFANPPDSAKPWCYWWWVNGHVDRETITADLESMKRLGFGGILMFDSRGYWDDEEHVVNPKAEIVWGSPAWYDFVEFSIRECSRLGLEFTMNASASGGTLNGFVDGKEYETDVMNRDEVVAHLDRAVGPLLKRVPDLVGKTFTHIYSVSYEGSVKTGGSWLKIKDNFYATMRDWAHAHGLKVYSESGGPWAWGSEHVKLDCDQLDMLAHNDFPQGEFWVLDGCLEGPDARRANRGGRFYQRAAVLSARRENRRIVSLEAFTHMLYHYSVDPSFLKPLADIAFADGANRLVWHTFTCSPKKFGVPGAEYFAGSPTPGTNNVLDDQRYVLNSTISPNTNSVMKFKINLSTNTTTVTIKLYTKINEFKNVAGGLDNYLQITWYSNLTVIPREVNGVIEYYEITIDNIERGHCLLELLIAPDLTTISPTPWAQESAIGWCNIIKSADVDIPW